MFFWARYPCSNRPAAVFAVLPKPFADNSPLPSPQQKPLAEEHVELAKQDDVTSTSRMASFLMLTADVPETLVGLGEYRDVKQV